MLNSQRLGEEVAHQYVGRAAQVLVELRRRRIFGGPIAERVHLAEKGHQIIARVVKELAEHFATNLFAASEAISKRSI